jgi:hypothetical protein
VSFSFERTYGMLANSIIGTLASGDKIYRLSATEKLSIRLLLGEHLQALQLLRVSLWTLPSYRHN